LVRTRRARARTTQKNAVVRPDLRRFLVDAGASEDDMSRAETEG